MVSRLSAILPLLSMRSGKPPVMFFLAPSSSSSVGPFNTWLTLTTTLKNAEKLTIPIAGNVVGEVSIFGPGWNGQTGLLRMGSFAGKSGKQVQLNVAIRGEHGPDAELQVAEVDPPQLQATLGEPKAMGAKRLHIPLLVEVPAGTAPIVRLGEPIGSEAHIVLRSSHPEIPDVRLRVRFAVE